MVCEDANSGLTFGRHQVRSDLQKRVIRAFRFFSIVVLACSSYALGQDTLKIVTYNVLAYSGTGSDSTTRNPSFRTVMKNLNADVLVVQEMKNLAANTNFLNSVLNAYQGGAYSTAPFNQSGGTNDSYNSFFYKPSKAVYLGASYIPTALRDIAEYRFRSIGSTDTVRIFSMHLKAGNTPDDTLKRLNETTILRNYLNGLPSGAKFIVAGDYNIYRSSEAAFQKLVGSEANNNGRSKDPLNAVGTWNNNYAFRLIQTQSPRVRSFGGGTTGGMDDRFDILLVSYPMDPSLILSSYTPYGNDGNHFNDSINRLPNSAVSDSVANALHYSSDHLPVFAKFVFQSGSGIAPEPTVQASNVQFDAVTSTSMNVTWTNGNGGGRIAIARAASPVSFIPNDGQAYSANTNFALAADLGSGNKAVFSGSSGSVTITGLTPNTTYYLAIYEFNGLANTTNYLATSPATNSQPTLSVSYYSNGNLPPDLLSSWNAERDGSGTQPSSFTSGVPFVIQSGDTMATSAPWTVSGTGNRILVEGGGILQANHLVSTATLLIDDGGTYVHNVASASSNGTSSDVPGSTARVFGVGSTVEFRKWANGGTSPVALPSGISWGNLIINVDTLGGSWQQSGGLTTIMGSLSIKSTGGGSREFRLNANSPATSTLNLAGDLLISGGIFNVTNGTAVETFNVGGNFLQTGGTFTATGAGPHAISFTGANPSGAFASVAGAFNSANVNWTVAPGKTLTLNTNLSVAVGRTIIVNGTLNCLANAVAGSGGVTVSAGATVEIGSADGINSGTTLGNIRVSGTRTFDTDANYELNGTTTQVSGNGFPATANNITVNNSNGVALTGGVTVNGTLTLVGGALSIGSNTITLNGGVDQSNGMLVGTLLSNVIFGGTGPSTILPAVALQNLTMNRPNGIVLAGPVSVSGVLTILSGVLSTGDNTITLGPSATLSEPAAYPILGTITTTRTVAQSVSNSFGGLGVELNALGASPGTTAVTRQTGFASEWNNSHSILRYFDLSPTTNTGLNATLVFHYEASELNGHDAGTLQLWKSTDTGVVWQSAGGSVNVSARTISVSGVSSLSRWTAADTLHFGSSLTTQSSSVMNGWNILSIPLTVLDYAKTSLFPTSTSSAFKFVGGVPPQGYVQVDTMRNGIGYWLKFGSDQTIQVSGNPRLKDTINVQSGWNMIGTIADTISTALVEQVPSGIVTSNYFFFNGGYTATNTLAPFRGYWVKVSQNGKLILDRSVSDQRSKIDRARSGE